MGSYSDESFEEFLDSLKAAGVVISNERELRERLAEVQRWRFAFMTLASNGGPLGIRFENPERELDEASIQRVFEQFHFSSSAEQVFAASLRVRH
ncbi:hypothetical protein B9N43_02725 [Denitratisoma sp. DHT3]|uniref:hypothetical protein n=1 Tax=Denitratisoma sp. DHT3 TaxID=1981880 RepID=UPI0011989107|nr:hypothetical protein [Denitratisoma sp. DHT3]QDX80271.1 hypothetical protein B9N43_02725 [Denitratisoma sp. DHT3]